MRGRTVRNAGGSEPFHSSGSSNFESLTENFDFQIALRKSLLF